MIYDKHRNYGDGEWHCPFTPKWVERMRRAVFVCKNMKVDDLYERFSNNENFLSSPQDSRGLPIGYSDAERPEVRLDIYDFKSIPEVVVTNGYDDWPLHYRFGVLTA